MEGIRRWRSHDVADKEEEQEQDHLTPRETYSLEGYQIIVGYWVVVFLVCPGWSRMGLWPVHVSPIHSSLSPSPTWCCSIEWLLPGCLVVVYD